MRALVAAAVLVTAVAVPARAEYESTCPPGDSEYVFVHDEGGSGERLYIDHPTTDRGDLCLEVVNEDPTLGIAIVFRGGTGVELTEVESYDCPITAVSQMDPRIWVGFGGPFCVDIEDRSYHVTWTTVQPVVEVWRVHDYGGPRTRII